MPKIKPLTTPKKKDPLRHMVKTLMDERDITQTALANALGVDNRSIHNWLERPGSFRVDNLRRIAEILGAKLEITLTEK